MIATDMRRRVYDLMQEGRSRQEIIDYMVARYGNFVTYDPPLTPRRDAGAGPGRVRRAGNLPHRRQGDYPLPPCGRFECPGMGK